MKHLRTYIIALCALVILGMTPADNSMAVGVFQNFDALPVTGANEIPGDGGGWRYSSHITKTKYDFFGSCGWWNTQEYTDHPGVTEYFDFYHADGQCNVHMGYANFGFLEIDDQNVIRGHSLKLTITGGNKDDGSGGCETRGLDLSTKEEYLAYINNGQNPVDSGEKVAIGKLYIMNDSYNNGNYPLQAAVGANMLSTYVYLPSGLTNNNQRGFAEITMGSDPFNHIGGHWYSNIYLNGGGWAHVITDTHPQHNNAWSSADNYPYPSYSLRAYGEEFFDNMHALYYSVGEYSGTDYPKYSIWFDEITFINDPYYTSMNNETINCPAVMMHGDGSHLFEIGWSGKYKNNGNYKSTYQVRYSFSQITNDNWSSAIPVHVQDFPAFGISANTNGIARRPNNWYQNMWISFKLRPSDEASLTPGTTIYFAIKDVSQDPNNLQVPNPAYNNGTDYANHMSEFDFAGDAPALPLIKRIDYYIAGGTGEPTPPPTPTPIIQSIQIN